MPSEYTKPSISGFNSSPPPDDGTAVASNEVKWSNHVDKLGTPLKTFAEAINDACEAAFGNLIIGTDVQAYDASFPFGSGTLMLFQQTAAPTGWTKQTTHNDKALRVVSGSVVNGGSSPFSTVFAKTATDSHTLTTNEIPSHRHGVGLDTEGTAGGGTSLSTSGSGTYTGYAGGGAGHPHNMDIRVQYVDLIIASKD